MIYFIILLLILYGAFVLDGKNVPYTNSIYKRLYYLVVTLLILVPGLSYRIGIDTPSYMRDFLYYDTLSTLTISSISESIFEPLWVIFTAICKSIFDDFAFMHVLDALIFTGTIVFVTNKLTNKRFWPLLFYLVCYWVHFNFGALREALAMSCFLLGLYHYIKTDNLISYIIWGMAAAFFHKFAFVIVIATMLALIWNKNKIFCIITLVAIMLIFIMYFEILIHILWYSSESFEDKVGGYIGLEGFSLIGIFTNLITKVIPPFLIREVYKKSSNAINRKICAVLLLATFVGIASSFVPLLDRFYNYLFPVIAVSFANLSSPNTAMPKLSRIILHTTVFLLFFFNVKNFCLPSALEYRSNINYNAAYFPYHSVFTMKEDPIREGLPRR